VIVAFFTAMSVSVLSNLGNGMFVVFFNNKPDITRAYITSFMPRL